MHHIWQVVVTLDEEEYAAMRWFHEDQLGFALGARQHCRRATHTLDMFVKLGIAAVREQFQKAQPARFEEVKRWAEEHPGPLGMEWSPARTSATTTNGPAAPS